MTSTASTDISLLPLQVRAALTSGRDMWSTVAVPEADIPSLKMADGPMGIASGRVDERDVSVLTPSGVSLGASWDPDLVRRVGEVVGSEAGRLGVGMVLAPNLNLPRSPLAGRAFELFSEDPFLTGALGVAWIEGLQSRGVGAAAKHLVCNDSETQRDRYNAVVDEKALREVYALPFEMAAKAGCAGILAAYNKVNGDWCAENPPLLTDLVKNDWGFEGVILSDWFGTHDTLGGARGGLDLEMPGPPRHLGPQVAARVEAGEVSVARLDDAAQRVARTARRFAGKALPPLPDAHIDDVLIEAAAAGFVLLRNESALLPMAPGVHKSLAVIGPNAAAPCFQGGTFAKIAVKPDALRPIDAIRARYQDHCDVVFEPGVDPQPRLPTMPVAPARDLGDGAVRGMTVDYFDSQDFSAAPIGSETRDTNSLTWFAGMHDLGAWDRPAGVRASGSYTAAADGDHGFYVGGTGALRLLVDGREIYANAREVKPSDLMGVLKGGDADRVDVPLKAGQTVEVVVELRYGQARAQGLWYGVRAPDRPEAMLARAVAAARAADAVILVVGETADAGVESKDRTSTHLTAEQLTLIDQVCAANANVVIVANVGHAFDLAWADKAKAVMISWYPGQEFGRALAQVLAGDREPGGRMPVTIASRDEDYEIFDLTPDAEGDLAYRESWKIGYRGFAARGIAPRFGLGAGTGYAAFDYSDLAVRVRPDRSELELEVRNTSDRGGKEVVQAYVTDPADGIPMLKGFVAVWLEARETRRVTVPLAERAFAHWDAAAHGWTMRPGLRQIAVGRALDDIRLAQDIEVSAL